jgi:hypothetical protein
MCLNPGRTQPKDYLMYEPITEPMEVAAKFVACIYLKVCVEEGNGISEEALKCFKDELMKTRHRIRRDGVITNTVDTLSLLLQEITVIIDVSDEQTLRAFNMLPKYLREELSEDEYDLMKMKVSVLCPKPFKWFTENQRDVLVFSDPDIFLQSLFLEWEKE